MSTEHQAAYAIREWCGEAKFSVSFYHKLQRQGRGPRKAHVGARTIITESPGKYFERVNMEATSASRMTEVV